MSPLLSAVAPQAVAFGLALSRVSGFVAVSPFPGSYVGPTQRVGLVVVMAWAATALVTARPGMGEIDARLIAGAISELGCGLVIGFAFRLVDAIASILGATIGQSMGLTTASAFNPAIDSHDTTMGQIATLLGMLVALGLGAHRVAIAYVLESFRVIPVGTSMAFPATVPLFVRMSGDAVTIGVRLAMPLVAAALAVQFALGLISRAAPSLQLFSVGLAILIGTGSIVLIESLGDMVVGLAAEYSRLPGHLDTVLRLLRDG